MKLVACEPAAANLTMFGQPPTTAARLWFSKGIQTTLWPPVLPPVTVKAPGATTVPG